jgi:thiosulfate/3-mercaptopyruvate sulfurtransferase
MSDITTAELAERLDDPSLVLLDVRRADEFTGDLVAPCDPRPGRIPGARHLDVAALLEARDAEAVRGLVGEPVGTEVVAYCHSGSRSAIAVQILGVAGYEARNYLGSWHEWSRHFELAAEVGSVSRGSVSPGSVPEGD